jgi:hypothetical protein
LKKYKAASHHQFPQEMWQLLDQGLSEVYEYMIKGLAGKASWTMLHQASVANVIGNLNSEKVFKMMNRRIKVLYKGLRKACGQ